MDDALLVSRALAGDLDSFGQLYDRYFNRIYDFCWRVLRDADEAGAATRDVFQTARRQLAGAKRAPSVKSWLFGIAHEAAMSRADARPPRPAAEHEEAFGAFDVPDPAQVPESVAAGDPALPALIWEAAASLSPRDYALLDLHMRQSLEPAEIAPIAGVGRRESATLTRRMERAADEAMAGYVLARRGPTCAGLGEVLSRHDYPPYSAAVRDAVAAHIRECDACRDARAALVPPLEVFAAFAPVQAPFAIKGDTWKELAADWGFVAEPDAIGVVPALAASTLPRQMEPPPALAYGGTGGGGGGYGTTALGDDADANRNRILLFVVAAAGMLVFAFAGGALIAGGFGGGDSGGAGGGGSVASRTSSPPGVNTNTPGVSVETPTPDKSVSPTPRPSETPEPSATQPAATAPPSSATHTAAVPTRTERPSRTPTSSRTPSPTRTVKPTQTPKPTKTPT
ncbi:MAG TPA: hypothetical protein VIH21_07190 [Dehalococcoidia bacterium]